MLPCRPRPGALSRVLSPTPPPPPLPQVRGVARLSAMLARLWPDTRSRPLLAAPDSNFDSSWFEALLRNAPFLQALSQHVYSGPGDMDSFPLRALSTSWLAKHVKSAMRMVESIHRVPQSRASPWVTEFASTYASGAPGSDTFASSLWYADALGSMAQSGYRMACRQTLVGGHYSLTRWGPGGALQPNPDFFVALLWRRLMGARVLQVRGSFWVERLRGHVHSARECAHYSSLDKPENARATRPWWAIRSASILSAKGCSPYHCRSGCEPTPTAPTRGRQAQSRSLSLTSTCRTHRESRLSICRARLCSSRPCRARSCCTAPGTSMICGPSLS